MSNYPQAEETAPPAWQRGWQQIRGGSRAAATVIGRSVAFLLKLTLLVYFVLCVLLLGLRYIVLPNIGAYKPQIEAIASRAIGNPVSIDGVQASWSGLRPQLGLDAVVIHDSNGRAALTLPRVDATLSWWSLVALEPRFDSLVILRPDLEVVRSADGTIYIAGIPVQSDQHARGGGADWVLSQREIRIRDGRLRWRDAGREAPELVLDGLRLVVRNGWRSHRLTLQARPPDGLAAPLDVRLAFVHAPFGPVSDMGRWRGELYLHLARADLAAWKPWLDYPFEVQAGRGTVRAWLDFEQGRFSDLTADLRLGAVDVRLAPELKPLQLAQASGRVAIRESMRDSGQDSTRLTHTLSLRDFSMRTLDGLVLPPTTISASHAPAVGEAAAEAEILAQVLDLRTLSDFAERLPLPEAERQLLAELAPNGTLRNFDARWRGTYPEIDTYSVRGEFEGVTLDPLPAMQARKQSDKGPALAARPALPGVANLSGKIEATERGGALTLASGNAVVRAPGYLAEPELHFEQLGMQMSWKREPRDRIELELHRLEFLHDEMTATLSGKHTMVRGAPGEGTLDLNARLDRVAVQKVRRYLPVQTSNDLRNWLTGALQGGTLEDVRLRVKGPLSHFPFKTPAGGGKARGEFSAVARIIDGQLDYAPGRFAADGRSPEWPVIEKIKGKIAFAGARMDINADAATTAGANLSRVRVSIPDLTVSEPMLLVEGEAAGALQNLVGFTRASPVGKWIGEMTETTTASGAARLSLGLRLPLNEPENSRVRGAVHFSGNTIKLFDDLPPLTATQGVLEFSETGFGLRDLRATFLGGPVVLTGGSRADGSIAVRAEGTLTADGIARVYTLPTSANGKRITGTARYATTIEIREGHPVVTVESSLAGLGLDFPTPLRKDAASTLPFRFEQRQMPGSDSLMLRDQIRLSLGSGIQAHYEREKPAVKDAPWRVVSGGIGVNAPAPEPDSGVYANFAVQSLNIDAWRRTVSSILSAPGTDSDSGSRDSSFGMAQYLEPEVLAARATELIVMDRKLDNVVVGASRQDGVWQANIDSEQASGYVTWAAPVQGRGLGRVTARLASLVIPESAESEVTELLEGGEQTEQLPALDVIAEQFVLFGKRLGELELTAANARGPEGREWRISKLQLTNPDGQLKATGRWTTRAGASRSFLDYALDIHDSGRLLTRLGFANVVRGGKGTMEGNINWQGAPFALDIPSLTGQIRLQLASGQFLKVDPAAEGAAKLLGVLSLQSLPRRLTLDFRDVFSEGFAFDGVNAAATISNGVARTENFKMRGVSATVLIDGSADIARENQDLHVVVIPEINAGAASVVYGLAVNPAVGVGTFLAQLFLREPLMKAFTYEYKITGPWSEPVVKRLGRAANESNANGMETGG